MADNEIIEESELVTIEEADEGPSLRDTLEAKWDEIHDGAGEESAPDESESGPVRDERGRFKPKSQEPDNSVTAATPESDAAQVLESAASEPPVPPPSSWAGDAKELFNQLPPRLQQEVARRETDLRRFLTQETEKIAQQSRTYAEIDEALAPRMNELQRAGVKPGEVVARFMAWQNYLDQNPSQGLRDLAQSYGLDLRQLAEQEAQQPQEPAYVKELRNQVQQMQGMLQQTVQKTEAEKQAEKVRSIVSELEAFSHETDASGNKLRPHIEQVSEDMVPYIQYLRTNNPGMSPRQILQAAYEKAVWANKSTRELELKRSQQVATPQKHLERAKRAVKLVNGEASGPEIVEKPANVRTALESAWEKIHG